MLPELSNNQCSQSCQIIDAPWGKNPLIMFIFQVHATTLCATDLYRNSIQSNFLGVCDIGA